MKGNFTFVLPVIFVLNLVSNAQVVPQKGIEQCDAQMAQQLVEQQAIESKSTLESDKRINILILVAEYLWDKDNDSARIYFAEAFKLAKERFKETGFRNNSTIKFYLDREPDYRFVVARAISRKDTEWARKLNEEILKSFDEDENVAKRDKYQQEAEIVESLDLAATLLDTNEAAATAIFRRLINYRLINAWNRILYRIAAKNPGLSFKIYSELLTKHSQDGIQELSALSGFPFGRTQTYSIGSYSSGPEFHPNFTPNLDIQSRFIRVFITRVLSMTPEVADSKENNQGASDVGYALGILDQIAPVVFQNFPGLRPDLARASAHVSALLDDQTRKRLKDSDNFKEQFSKTFEERIEALDEADSLGTLKDFEIVTLINQAKSEADFNSLEKWLDRINDPEVKEKSVNFFYFSRAKLAVKEKRFTEARKLADKVPQIEFRAVLYFDIADAKLKEPLEKYETFEILSEVFKVAEKAPDSVEKAQVLLGVGFMFEKIDHANSIEAISKSIRTANKLENPKLFTDTIMQHITGDDFGIFSNYRVPGFDINKTFDQISKTDFRGAISLAEDFSDKYLRTLAVLAAVKDCKPIEPIKAKPKSEKSRNSAPRR
jgi:hypothetical protein